MSGPNSVTERSPLLGREHRERRDDDTAATSAAVKAQSGAETSNDNSAPHDDNETDIERHEQSGEGDDPETLRVAKSIKYILPVLGVGVRSLRSKRYLLEKLMNTDTVGIPGPVDCFCHQWKHW